MTIFEAVGGEETFFHLADAFYVGVEEDPILRTLYPTDLGPAKRHLALFLIQYFGGPNTYSRERGHPRLRGRHLPFPIDQAARDAWVRNMEIAVSTLNVPEAARQEFMSYFENAATFLINR